MLMFNRLWDLVEKNRVTEVSPIHTNPHKKYLKKTSKKNWGRLCFFYHQTPPNSQIVSLFKKKIQGTRWAIHRRHGPRAVAPRQWAVSTGSTKCSWDVGREDNRLRWRIIPVTHSIHVWNICLHLPYKSTKCG